MNRSSNQSLKLGMHDWFLKIWEKNGENVEFFRSFPRIRSRWQQAMTALKIGTLKSVQRKAKHSKIWFFNRTQKMWMFSRITKANSFFSSWWKPVQSDLAFRAFQMCASAPPSLLSFPSSPSHPGHMSQSQDQFVTTSKSCKNETYPVKEAQPVRAVETCNLTTCLQVFVESVSVRALLSWRSSERESAEKNRARL
jgi:hypothetical protein